VSATISPTPDTDGRVRRGARNRDALVDALLELLEHDVAKPTAREIAERAGVSLRTVFTHFDDVESLYAAIAVRQRERLAPLFDHLDADGPLEDRIEALVAQRVELFEQIAPVRRASLLLSPESPELTRRLAEASRALREQLSGSFEAELAMAGRGRTELLAALDVSTSWETWDGLRRGQGLSVAAARRSLRLLVTRLLADD
jgi:TetR/AcrR family transcriptional regulator, regulator of autoinduction and epiphytic fitness